MLVVLDLFVSWFWCEHIQGSTLTVVKTLCVINGTNICARITESSVVAFDITKKCGTAVLLSSLVARSNNSSRSSNFATNLCRKFSFAYVATRVTTVLRARVF